MAKPFVAASAAVENEAARSGIVRHVVVASGPRPLGLQPLPSLGRPRPGVAEVPFNCTPSMDHQPVVHRVVGHCVTTTRRGAGLALVKRTPTLAVPPPQIGQDFAARTLSAEDNDQLKSGVIGRSVGATRNRSVLRGEATARPQ